MAKKPPKTISEALKPAQPRRQLVGTKERSSLEAYNRGQPVGDSDGPGAIYRPEPEKPRSFRDVLNPGRFQMDTRNGVLSARGAGSEGGGGSGSSGGGAEAPVPQKSLPRQAGTKMGGVGTVFAEAAKTQADRDATASTQASLPKRTYSQGVLSTMDEEAKRPEASALYQQSLKMPRSVGEVMRAAINAGDVSTAHEAASAATELVARGQHNANNERALADRVWEKFHLRQRAEQALRDEERQKYEQAAQRNTQRAQANSSAAIGMGMDPLSGQPQMQAEQRRRNQMAYPQAGAAELQKLAAQGDVDAARALEGQPGPWAPGSPQMGVRARDQARENDVIQQRYVQPTQIKTQGALTKQQLIQQGKTEQEANRMLIEQNKLTERQYEAQLKASGYEGRQATQLAMQFGKTNNTARLAAGLEPLSVGDYHAAVQQMSQGRTPAPAAPSFQQAGPMGSGPAGGAGPAAPPPTQEAEAFTAEFSSLPPHEKAQVIADLEASGDAAHAAYFRSMMR